MDALPLWPAIDATGSTRFRMSLGIQQLTAADTLPSSTTALLVCAIQRGSAVRIYPSVSLLAAE